MTDRNVDPRALRVCVTEGLAGRLAQGSIVIPGNGPDRPDLMFLDPQFGVVLVEFDGGSDPEDRQPYVRLNRKAQELVSALPQLADIRPAKAVLFGGCERITSQSNGSETRALGVRDAEDGSWWETLSPQPLALDQLGDLVESLAPQLQFHLRGRQGAEDPGAAERAHWRVQLDAEQAVVATGQLNEVLLLDGPPGSGKTLALAARARWLASRHPDWHIQVLCFNSALVPCLRSLVADTPQTSVCTFAKYSRDNDVYLSFDDTDEASMGLKRAREAGIPVLTDALLIDEVQDFRWPWIAYCLETLRPDRGGAVLAGDGAQALYVDDDLSRALRGRQVSTARLHRPYRSTAEILRVTASLTESFSVAGIEHAPSGEPVELIWAENWDGQASAIAWEVQQLLASGEREPADIGVLVTQRPSTIKRLHASFDARDIPYLTVTKANAGDFDPNDPSVKIITVHSAKGHEFAVVFLFGLETLPEPIGCEPEKVRRARVGFVGMTRARDQLLITYTRDNAFLTRIRAVNDDVRTWVWPDDYEVES